MKKFLYSVFSLCLAASMLIGCSSTDSSLSETDKGSDSQYASEDDLSGSDPADADSSDTFSDRNITGTSINMNIAVRLDSGDSVESALADPLDISKGIDITVDVSFDAITNSGLTDLDAEIFMFCNGNIISFSDSKNGEPTEMMRFDMENFSSKELPLYIFPTSIGNVDEAPLWVYINFVPDYVPGDVMGNICTSSAWYIPVKSSDENNECSVYEAQDADYINDKRPYSSGGRSYDPPYADIGIFKPQLNSVSRLSIIDDEIIDGTSDFSVAAFFDNDYDYYLAVLCNGELVNAFDGCKLMKVNCQGGKRMVKYSLDKSELPQNGEYGFSIIALPSGTEKRDNGSEEYIGDTKKIIISMSGN